MQLHQLRNRSEKLCMIGSPPTTDANSLETVRRSYLGSFHSGMRSNNLDSWYFYFFPIMSVSTNYTIFHHLPFMTTFDVGSCTICKVYTSSSSDLTEEYAPVAKNFFDPPPIPLSISFWSARRRSSSDGIFQYVSKFFIRPGDYLLPVDCKTISDCGSMGWVDDVTLKAAFK